MEPVKEQSSSKKICLIAALLFFLILLIAAGAYYFYYSSQKSQKKQGGSQSQNVATKKTDQSKTTTPCASTLTDSNKTEIQLWKTYENSKYQYSFKYPETWTISNQNDNLIELKDKEADLIFQFFTGEDLLQDWNIESSSQVVVACQKSLKKALTSSDSSRSGLSITFTEGENKYSVLISYKFIGASLSSDIVEAYDLILKTIEFK